MNTGPIEIPLPLVVRRRAEQQAMLRAVRWVRRDGYYQDKALTSRERALIRLALRCLTDPVGTEIALRLLPDQGPDVTLLIPAVPTLSLDVREGLPVDPVQAPAGDLDAEAPQQGQDLGVGEHVAQGT